MVSTDPPHPRNKQNTIKIALLHCFVKLYLRVWSQNAINATVKKIDLPKSKAQYMSHIAFCKEIPSLSGSSSGILSHFANKWKWDCICLPIVDLFAVVSQFFHSGVYRVL